MGISRALKRQVLTGVNTTAKVLVVFPPFVAFATNHPYLSLPLLAGYLRKRGVPTDQRDLNAEFIRYALNGARFRHMAAGYDDQLASLEAGGHTQEYEEVLKKRLEVECLPRHMPWMMADHAFSPRMAMILSHADPRLGEGVAFDDLYEVERIAGEENPYHAFFEDRLWDDIEREGYRVIGFSVAMSPQLAPALCFARMIHAKNPSIHVVLGGGAINLADDETLARIGGLPYVHGIVRFGGGATLLDVVNALAAGDRGRGIANYIDCSEGRPRFPAAYESASVEESADCYFDRRILSLCPDPPVLPVLYSMGCYWGKCTFCTYPKLFRDAFQLREVVGLVDQLESLAHTHGCRHFHLIGECLPPRYAVQVADEIIARGLDIKFGSFLRIDRRFTPEVLQRLAEAGFEWATIGVESTNDRVLALMGKGYTAKMIAPQLRWCREAGISVTVDMIIDFPTTTKEEALRVLEDARTMADDGHGLSFESFILEKGTEVWSHAEAYGIEVGGGGAAAPSVRKGFLRWRAVPFIDRAGMCKADRTEVTRLYRDLEREVRLRPYRAMFWRQDAASGRLDWSLLAQFAKNFLMIYSRPTGSGLASTPEGPTDAGKHLCYNFLEDELFPIDDLARQCLQAIQSMPDDRAGDLPAYLAAQGCGSRERVENDLHAIFTRCLNPRPTHREAAP